MRYPFKSNWISYKRIKGTDEYIVKNHLLEEEYSVSADCISFINRLDGKTDPLKLLRSMGMEHYEARNFIDELEEIGAIRKSKRIPYAGAMKSVVLVDESFKYKEISIVLMVLQLLMFIPAIYVLFHYTGLIMRYGDIWSGGEMQLWFGIIAGVLIGAVFHELYHAISCIAFSPDNEKSVLEFGITFSILPAAYTLMDTRKMSKIGRILTYLAGVITNVIIAAICIYLTTVSYDFCTFFFYMAISNIELALVNSLLIDTLDGRHAMDEMLGIYSNCKGIITRNDELYTDEERVLPIWVSRMLMLTKIMYPALIIFNFATFMGW